MPTDGSCFSHLLIERVSKNPGSQKIGIFGLFIHVTYYIVKYAIVTIPDRSYSVSVETIGD